VIQREMWKQRKKGRNRERHLETKRERERESEIQREKEGHRDPGRVDRYSLKE